MADIISRPYSKQGQDNYDKIFRRDPKTCGHKWIVVSGEYKCAKCGITPLELQQMVMELEKDD